MTKKEFEKSGIDIEKCIEYSEKLKSSYESGMCRDSRSYIAEKIEVLKGNDVKGLEELVSLVEMAI